MPFPLVCMTRYSSILVVVKLTISTRYKQASYWLYTNLASLLICSKLFSLPKKNRSVKKIFETHMCLLLFTFDCHEWADLPCTGRDTRPALIVTKCDRI